jgi:hypothetical protein
MKELNIITMLDFGMLLWLRKQFERALSPESNTKKLLVWIINFENLRQVLAQVIADRKE